jgi:transcriptional regulator with XRE-family HTH domain
MSIKRPATRETLARNLQMLMEVRGWTQTSLAQKSGVSQRQISNILNAKTGCSVEHADALAKAFGLHGWHLIMPSLPEDLVNGALSRLLDNYLASSTEGRAAIDHLAELERKVAPIKPTKT